jgi:hypothetical protein
MPCALTNIDGLAALTSVDGDVIISSNGALTQFCGLFPLLDSRTVGGTILISANGINVTETDILEPGFCPVTSVLNSRDS